MRSPRTKFLLFNAAAALAGVGAVLAAAWSVLMPTPIARCSERYHALTTFGLERGGVALTAADLQASLGGKDVGVIDSVTIGPLKDAPAPLVMAVSLQKASTSLTGQTTPFTGGTSFHWQPRALQGKASTCLSYSVLLPANFEFHRGGVLPGIAGTDGNEQGDKFAAQLVWRVNEGGGVTVRVSENGVSRGLPVEPRAIELPRGRWVKVEQEAILNTPKMQDGTLRVWVDGALVVDRRDIAYRAKPDVTIAGVAVDVFRGAGPTDQRAAANKDAKVRLTPFEVRWQ
jgi:hypothetical protein